MDSGSETQLRLLLDKDEIREVLARYVQGVDRGDHDVIASCFYPEAIDDHGGVYVTGAEAAVRYSSSRRRSATGQMLQHLLGNTSIDVDGDTAYVETYFVAFLNVERDGDEYTAFRGARYLDRFERRDGSWKIAYRVVVDDWDRMDKKTESAPGRDAWRRGNIRELDPSAQFRRGAIADNESTIRDLLKQRDRSPAASHK